MASPNKSIATLLGTNPAKQIDHDSRPLRNQAAGTLVQSVTSLGNYLNLSPTPTGIYCLPYSSRIAAPQHRKAIHRCKASPMELNKDTVNPEAAPSLPSCDGCRTRKLKCSRQRPSCSNCRRLGKYATSFPARSWTYRVALLTFPFP